MSAFEGKTTILTKPISEKLVNDCPSGSIWPGRKIPYIINNNFCARVKNLIIASIREWNETVEDIKWRALEDTHPCIRAHRVEFKPWSKPNTLQASGIGFVQ